ncbi:unnamed protein product [Soboliphyme baturini]|uniref:PE family protein n=1 Tax=Soboliphyme baturini TaxID=241478 RepID=A0A183J6N3_9BILA|nr:unnamed protein product [Soboliphyme baturini]
MKPVTLVDKGHFEGGPEPLASTGVSNLSHLNTAAAAVAAGFPSPDTAMAQQHQGTSWLVVVTSSAHLPIV